LELRHRARSGTNCRQCARSDRRHRFTLTKRLGRRPAAMDEPARDSVAECTFDANLLRLRPRQADRAWIHLCARALPLSSSPGRAIAQMPTRVTSKATRWLTRAVADVTVAVTKPMSKAVIPSAMPTTSNATSRPASRRSQCVAPVLALVSTGRR
jgi:hypothetical protein